MVKLYVEGGGNTNLLRTACREGFSAFLAAAGIGGKMPRIVACGSRQEAYDDFCTAIKNSEEAYLLVDSEAAVSPQHQEGDDLEKWRPWAHLRARDGWAQPDGATDLQCHLMVFCTESWFLADPGTLEKFFGQGFKKTKLPKLANGVEGFSKEQIYKALEAATAQCKTKSAYGKGEHSFKILKAISPAEVSDRSPWAKRLIAELK